MDGQSNVWLSGKIRLLRNPAVAGSNLARESLACKIGKRAMITLGCLLFRFQCTTNVSRTYIQASELGLALMPIKCLIKEFKINKKNCGELHLYKVTLN